MTIRIPAEWEPHECCWMAWAHREWDKATANKIRRDLSEVVQTLRATSRSACWPDLGKACERQDANLLPART
jgi:agmatine/peptidylarginine deiminase